MSSTVVIGVGNALRGDDAAGLCLARLLAARGLAGVTVHESSGETASLMELWQGAETVVIVDAAQSGAPPGNVERFDVSTKPLPAAALHCSTHAFGVAEAVELARSLGCLPPRTIVFGLEGASFEHGAALSSAMEKAVQKTAELIEAEVKN